MSKQHFRDRIKRTGKTQQEMASQLGISQGYLSRLMNGKAVPSLGMAVRLAHASGASVESFLPEREPEHDAA